MSEKQEASLRETDPPWNPHRADTLNPKQGTLIRYPYF